MSRLDTEGRLSDIKGNGERLMRAMTEDANRSKMIEGWNADTLSRYLNVGKRLGIPKVTRWLTVWEAAFKRNALLDEITMLRACDRVTSDDDERAMTEDSSKIEG